MLERILLASGNLKENTWKRHYILIFNTFFFLVENYVIFYIEIYSVLSFRSYYFLSVLLIIF
jgi:hypothetical protein